MSFSNEVKYQNIKLSEEIVFVTSNKGKIASAQRCFKDIKLEICNHELIEPRTDDIKEISEFKVKQAYDIVKKPCMALDAGFFIEALNGFPRAFVNFSLDTIGIEGILKLMKDVEDRDCAFKECLSYYDGQSLLNFYGNIKGLLSTQIRKTNNEQIWSDLWYIFIPYGYDKTLSELSDEERSNIPRCKENTSAMEEFALYYNKTKKLVR